MAPRPVYSGDRQKLIIGIDVGTTFSGISYCLLEPGKVPQILPVTRFPPQPLVGGDSKVPSIVYYDKDGRARALGAEAMDENVRERATEEGWQKAEWFKLDMRPDSVCLPRLDGDIPLLPADKTAHDIFADFLNYLLKCARTYFSEHYPSGEAMWITLEDGIEYILTHPNGWEGEQQAKLRNAAVVAGLVPDNSAGYSRIHFVTEGEASLNFCILNGLAGGPLNKGNGVIIVDAGGGTVDISAYRKVSNDKGDSFEEIAQTACLMHGSVFVTKNAREHLEVALRNSKYHADIAEITECFDQSTKLKFRSPNEFSYIRFGTLRDKDPAFNITNGQMKLSGTTVATFFKPSIHSIVQAVEQQCVASSVPISSVFLVGGFAASEWLFSELKRRLAQSGLEVSRPDSHFNKAVSDGAVSFYLDHFVSARISKDTYGIDIYTAYNSANTEHLRRASSTFVDASGQLSIAGQFRSILPRGISVSETTEFRKSFRWLQSSISQLSSNSVEVLRYQGKNQDPCWLDVDSENYVTLCGIRADTSQAAANLRPLFGEQGMYYKLEFDVVFSFGTTELKAQIAWQENGVEKRGPAEILYERLGERAASGLI
ncbi:hypothetical protein C8F01DRAFT_206812 [Mycena amicta]|nr:hypothetical protein C8F01DRAFT_206812 [Mycena amicta]